MHTVSCASRQCVVGRRWELSVSLISFLFSVSRFSAHPETPEQLGSALKYQSSLDSDNMPG